MGSIMPNGFKWPVTKDGYHIVPGDVYYGEDGKQWCVAKITIDTPDCDIQDKYCIHATIPFFPFVGSSKRDLKPRWLTKNAPILTSDGVAISCGMRVYTPANAECTIHSIDWDKKECTVLIEEFGVYKDYKPEMLSVERKETYKDIINDVERMFDNAYDKTCVINLLDRVRRLYIGD